jgi:hypothetical protein
MVASLMKLCTTCHRHVRASERACPFCGEALHADEAPRLGTVVLLGVLGAACVLGPSNETASGEESSGGSVGASTSAGATTNGTSTGAPSSTTSTSTSGPTATGEMSSASDVDSGDAGCAFYGGCPVDVGPDPNACSPWVQDCPDGEKCMPFASDGGNSWNALKCVPVAREPGKPGEPCTVEGSGVSGLDDCEVGAMCWSVDEGTKQGVCAAMCTGSPDQPMCEDPETTCLIANDGVLTLCLLNCDPLLNECAEDEVCVPNPQGEDSFLCVQDISGDEGQEFEECGPINSCDPGLLCTFPELAVECDQNAPRCCVAFCDLTMPACNGEGAECVAWFEEGMAPEGLDHLGVCRIPE